MHDKELESPNAEIGILHRGHWAEAASSPGSSRPRTRTVLVNYLLYAHCMVRHSSESHFQTH